MKKQQRITFQKLIHWFKSWPQDQKGLRPWSEERATLGGIMWVPRAGVKLDGIPPPPGLHCPPHTLTPSGMTVLDRQAPWAPLCVKLLSANFHPPCCMVCSNVPRLLLSPSGTWTSRVDLGISVYPLPGAEVRAQCRDVEVSQKESLRSPWGREERTGR